MTDQELAAEARRVATTLSGSRSDLGRYAGGLLAELADRAERRLGRGRARRGEEQAVNETAQDGKDRRHARIGALTDSQRWELLAYLCGRWPEAVDTSLDQLEGDWRRWQAAAQATEESDG